MPTFGPTCKQIIRAALKAVDPETLVFNRVTRQGEDLTIRGQGHVSRTYHLKDYAGIHVLGAGKGAPFLFQALEKIIGHRLTGGLIISLPEHAFAHPLVRFLPGSHPLPDERSLLAGEAIEAYVRERVKPRDLVFFLITGGASAMMVSPAPGIEFQDKVDINRLLLSCGADIREINCVRKSLSRLKGGGLARLIAPASLVTLIISDIVDSPPADIGSGPTIPATSTCAEATAILGKYRLLERMNPRVLTYLSKGAGKERAKKFSKQDFFILADTATALDAAQKSARSLGFYAHILSARDRGEAAEAAKIYAAIIEEIILTGQPFAPPVVLLAGGELTVTLKGKGKGGRNQEFVLGLLKELQYLDRPIYAMSIGTDGLDGPTDAAGAWIDRRTAAKAGKMGLHIGQYLADNDAYRFFQAIGQLVKTGPTRTNVADIRVFYIGTPGST